MNQKLIVLMGRHNHLLAQRAKLTDEIRGVYAEMVAVQREEEKRPDYHEYIQSDAWKEKAKEARERAGFRCQVCNVRDVRLNVHHRTYERLGREEPEDIICLCEACHETFHVHGKLAKPDGVAA